MEDYRQIQRKRHEEWKQHQTEEDAKREANERKRILQEEQTFKDNFLSTEVTTWIAEGFDLDAARIIAMGLLQTHLLMKHQSVQFIHAKNSVPRLFGLCSMASDMKYYFFDLRLLMDHLFFKSRVSNSLSCPPHPSAPILFQTGVALDPSAWIVMLEYWKVVDPYQHLEYKTRPHYLHLKTIENEPHTDIDLQKYVTELCNAGNTISSPFDRDQQLGAFSVALPMTIMDPLVDYMDSGPLAVELCIPGHSLRVYAYCRNPDECSDHSTVRVPWRLKYLMKAFEDQEVYVRVFSPPAIPIEPNLPALRVIMVTKLPETTDEGELRAALNRTINHQRVVFPGQVILIYVQNVFGPIPFMVAQVYMKNGSHGRLPVGVTSVYGHGSGIDCAIETISDDRDEQTTTTQPGFEKYFVYLKNLKERSYDPGVTSSPPSHAMVAKSIRDNFF